MQPGAVDASAALAEAAAAMEGYSGRMLRKLPFLAHAKASGLQRGGVPSCQAFAVLLKAAAEAESADRALMK